MSDASPDSADDRSGATGTSSAVSPDGAFRALADPQRRALVSYLYERPNESVTVETLAGALTHETGSDQRHVAAELATVQLPKLDACAVVNYDAEQRTVEYTDSSLVDELLARLHE